MLVNLSNQIGSILLITVYIGGLLLIAEILNRLHKTDSELTRKIVHIGTGNVILLAWWLNITSDVILLAVITASIVAIASYYLPILPSVNSVGRHSLGTLFYAISIGILTALFWHEGEKQFTAIGILIMSYGDGMAALIGQKWGKHKYQLLGNKKSWEGSLTMTLVSILVVISIFGIVATIQTKLFIIALLIGIFATILETFSPFGIDNLTVPVICGILAYYLHNIFTIN
ncbi:diacylglycerol/polyprenol kinase family protein [Cyanobacterium sp. Dongsha4]|uniref:diacylglycerol/polyprenol kinase family protein n=1 Tax=Cyanobacterium sp. DS4 TaxID=2878255 RepID=UPI002E80B9E4|nr:diacylglycerol/polyprenol kinase family protein [Cyanobacterium sp. Dongsha4]WVL00362.1 SEC59/DGK1/VTE5 family protein [Cyanobacterium sp. Dongsha4]